MIKPDATPSEATADIARARKQVHRNIETYLSGVPEPVRMASGRAACALWQTAEDLIASSQSNAQPGEAQRLHKDLRRSVLELFGDDVDSGSSLLVAIMLCASASHVAMVCSGLASLPTKRKG